MSEHHLSSADIRKKIGHPVIDGDGHLVEYMPAYVEYLKQVAGPKMVERFQSSMARNIGPYWFNLDTAARREKGVPRGPWWGRSTKNTLDGATAMLPNPGGTMSAIVVTSVVATLPMLVTLTV